MLDLPILRRVSSAHDSELEREVETAIAEAVARFGMAGEVLIEKGEARLVGAGPEVVTEIGNVLDTWSALAPELRTRRATEIARRLVTARRASLSPDVARRSLNIGRYVTPIVILCVTGAAIWLAFQYLSPGSGGLAKLFGGGAPSATGPRNIDEYEAERTARAERACEATRARIQRGATVGPADVEGWVVEIVVLRPPDAGDPLADPALGEFISKRDDAGARFVWSGAPDIAELEGITTEVVVAEEPAAKLRGIRFTFKGSYVTSYFHPGTSRHFITVAAALSEKLRGRYAGLYARCAHTETHHLGAWFFGPSPAGASAALIYFMGVFHDPPQLRQSILFPEGGTDVRASDIVQRVETGLAGFDRVKVRNVVSEQGGMISGPNEGPCALTFPFSDANRASRASLELARVGGVGLER